METIKDKMLKVIRENQKDFMEKLNRGDTIQKSLNQVISEACARVAEEEIKRVTNG